MRDVSVLHRRWVMVWWQGVVGIIRSLTHHVISAAGIGRLAHCRSHRWPRLVTRVIHVWSSELRTTLLRRHVAIVRPSGWRHRRHTITGHEGLRLGVEGVPVEAAGNRMLTLRVMGVNVGRKSAKGIRYPCLRHWSSPGLVRALAERRGRRLLLRPAVLLLRR